MCKTCYSPKHYWLEPENGGGPSANTSCIYHTTPGPSISALQLTLFPGVAYMCLRFFHIGSKKTGLGSTRKWSQFVGLSFSLKLKQRETSSQIDLTPAKSSHKNSGRDHPFFFTARCPDTNPDGK